MILLLGATGYVGQAFARALRSRRDSFIPLSRSAFDYTRFEFLFDYMRKVSPALVINADERAGGMEWWSDDAVGPKSGLLEEWSDETMGGESRVMDCWSNGVVGGDGAKEKHLEMLRINAVLPQTVTRASAMTNIPWAQVSSGSIYSGAKVVEETGKIRVERNLEDPAVRKCFDLNPERFLGYSELDEPNCSFKSGACTFYTGTKALGEEAIRNAGRGYIWRLGLPFNEQNGPNNFLSRLQEARSVHYGVNSLSQIDDCVGACLELWERHAPFGIYNVANPGTVSTHEVAHMIQHILKRVRPLECWSEGDQAERVEERRPLSHCILDVSKLRGIGIKLPDVREALEKSLKKWVSAAGSDTKEPAPFRPVVVK